MIYKVHFYPALLKRFILRKLKKKFIEIWGSVAQEESYYTDDLQMLYFFMKKKLKKIILTLVLEEFSITYMLSLMKMLNINLKINKNKTMPDGVKSKLMNSSLALKHGLCPKIYLVNGLETISKI